MGSPIHLREAWKHDRMEENNLCFVETPEIKHSASENFVKLFFNEFENISVLRLCCSCFQGRNDTFSHQNDDAMKNNSLHVSWLSPWVLEVLRTLQVASLATGQSVSPCKPISGHDGELGSGLEGSGSAPITCNLQFLKLKHKKVFSFGGVYVFCPSGLQSDKILIQVFSNR